MPSAISGCGGSPWRRSVASSPRRISEVVTPIRGLMPQSSAAGTRGRIRDCSTRRGFLAMYVWRGICGVLLYRVSGVLSPVQSLLEGSDAVAEAVSDARPVAHVERPERPSSVDADHRRVRAGLALELDVAGRPEAAAGQLDLDAGRNQDGGGPEPAADVQLDLRTGQHGVAEVELDRAADVGVVGGRGRVPAATAPVRREGHLVALALGGGRPLGRDGEVRGEL